MTRNLAALAGVLALAGAADAMRRMAEPLPVRLVTADAVFVGKVAAVGSEKGEYRPSRVLKVTVSQSLLGDAGKEAVVVIPAQGTMASTGPAAAEGDEVLVLARKHPTRKGAFVADAYEGVFSSKGSRDYKVVLAEAGKVSDLLAEPMKSLKAKAAGDRSLAAMLLILRYKTPSGGKEQGRSRGREPADPASAGRGRLDGPGSVSPRTAFSRLGATAKDGWTPPKEFRAFADEARKWLKDNAGKYEMTRFAREAK